MKKELIATSILIMVLILAFTNIRHLDNTIAEIIKIVDTSERQMESGDLDSASASIEAVIAKWTEKEWYTHVFIRQNQDDSIVDSFYELLSDLYSDNTGEAKSGYKKLRAQLKEMAETEHLKFANIF